MTNEAPGEIVVAGRVCHFFQSPVGNWYIRDLDIDSDSLFKALVLYGDGEWRPAKPKGDWTWPDEESARAFARSRATQADPWAMLTATATLVGFGTYYEVWKFSNHPRPITLMNPGNKQGTWFSEPRSMPEIAAEHEAKAAQPTAEPPPDGVALIAAERKRQVESEGWTPEHDDMHQLEELASAAACYVTPDFAGPGRGRRLAADPSVRIFVPDLWPWDADWWKPGDRIRELVKAGALIAAEIDRLQRLKTPGENL